MHRLISGLLVVLCIFVWGVALVVFLEAAYFTSADGLPLRMKVTNHIPCPQCRGRFVSQDSGLHFQCFDCGERGGEECLSNR
jgi:hypothetical protein